MSHLINMTAKAMVPHDVSSSAHSQTVNIRVDGYLIFVCINFGQADFNFCKMLPELVCNSLQWSHKWISSHAETVLNRIFSHLGLASEHNNHCWVWAVQIPDLLDMSVLCGVINTHASTHTHTHWRTHTLIPVTAWPIKYLARIPAPVLNIHLFFQDK